MPVPKPAVSLTGACSVIHDNTLYEYSSQGFQSLKLEQKEEWKKLSDGKAVEGGVCVGSTPKDASKAGLYIVGGTSTDPDYKGIQKFTYSTGKWESINPTVSVTQSRLWHSAVYLNASDSILVYAGAQDGSQHLSSQTFTVGASEPYTVLAYQSIAPPAIAPILLQWSEAQAVMVGGDATNTKVMLFDAKAGWTDSNSTLAEPITKGTTQVKASLLTADDGSKHLYTFDMSKSPNEVQRLVLMDAAGPVVKSTPIRKAKSASRSLRRRDLTASNWPEYNSTLAPTTVRDQYSLASGSDGLVVMSGGNDNDAFCMFNARENCWENATAKLVGTEDFAIASLPTGSATSDPTDVPSPLAVPGPAETSATADIPPAAASAPKKMETGQILGISLGVIFGVAVMLIALLFWLRRKKQRQNYIEQGHNRRASGVQEKQDYLPNTAKATGGYYRGHGQQESAGSFSSMAILMGKLQKPSAVERQNSVNSGVSKRSSVSSILAKQFKSTIGRPVPQPSTSPIYESRNEKGVSFAAEVEDPKPRDGPAVNRDGETRRSSGWNRYWSGGSTLNILGWGPGSRRETQTSDSSHYSNVQHRMTQDSATVPPLQVEGRPSFSRVHTGSPTVSHINSQISEGMSGQIERPLSSTSSSGYSSGIPPSVHEQWDPTTAKKPWGQDRAPSTAYTASVYTTHLGLPENSRPPTGISKQPQLHTAATSDMSWLNLGGDNNNRL
ncbi:pre-mRNA splicing factor clf1 [Apiospora rasikravindrae]|uniref:Pre-mRNA splicing factor clf1 n=1 Tax=Apiospora rasikravindrae TaxID=990691 RepID=A0ABR1UB73_9PEZI